MEAHTAHTGHREDKAHTEERVYGFTRWEHGARPVEKTDAGKWVIHYADHKEEYDSGRALMRALHGGRDPHLTVERYFRRGKHKSPHLKPVPEDSTPALSTLALFSDAPEAEERRDRPMIGGFSVQVHSQPKTTKRVRLRRAKPAPQKDGGLLSFFQAPAIKLGIDLENRSHEVRKLLFAGFGKRIIAMGYDPEDVLQDVYRGLLARNIGRCPWDARKASFGHYVHMVCSCILSNYHRRYDRINKREQPGAMDWQDGARVLVDVASSSLPKYKADQGDSIQRHELIEELEQKIIEEIDEPYVALNALPYVLEGRGRRETAKLIGEREGVVGAAINEIKRLAIDLLG